MVESYANKVHTIAQNMQRNLTKSWRFRMRKLRDASARLSYPLFRTFSHPVRSIFPGSAVKFDKNFRSGCSDGRNFHSDIIDTIHKNVYFVFAIMSIRRRIHFHGLRWNKLNTFALTVKTRNLWKTELYCLFSVVHQ